MGSLTLGSSYPAVARWCPSTTSPTTGPKGSPASSSPWRSPLLLISPRCKCACWKICLALLCTRSGSTSEVLLGVLSLHFNQQPRVDKRQVYQRVDPCPVSAVVVDQFMGSI